MVWFESSIPAAIASAQQQNFIFVVVITGEDGQSAQLMSSWEDEKVSEAAQTCCVAIKVDAKSETCVQFTQIYPVVYIPSSFFIGENGIPLEVIAGSVSADELTKRISKVKQMQGQQVCGGIVASTEPEALATTEAVPVPGTSKESLSRPADESGLLGAEGPGEDRSASSDDTSHSSQCDGTLNANVDRSSGQLQHLGTNSSPFYHCLCHLRRKPI
ncbi:UBX domain-containing protein 4-like [Lampris incognitus]|uniref:UBX domain-containing protein 4-like n=1 Tax=Lampris incognitus TaxID=2546036 RepID=UPI0024B49419|nr:UBX domain-containing protein 4-like [Lampris incognitus]